MPYIPRKRPKAKPGSRKRGPKPKSTPPTGPKPARTAPRGPTTDAAQRGAVVALEKAGLPMKEIANITHVKERTAYDIVTRAKRKAAEIDGKENQDPETQRMSTTKRLKVDPLAVPENTIHTVKPPGRPDKFSDAQKTRLAELVKRDAQHRRMSATQLSRQWMAEEKERTGAEVHMSVPTAIKILHERGLRQHIARFKPPISAKNKQMRFEYCDKYKDKSVPQYWSGGLFTDEMHYNLDDRFNVRPVWREDTEEEEWNPDCVDTELNTEVRQMFWGVIIWGVSCSECPFYVWEQETEEQKEEASTTLAAENAEAMCRAEETMGMSLSEWMEREKERRDALPKGQKPKGRIGVPKEFKVGQVTRGKKRKGGIDWYRYRKEVCEGPGMLYDFYDKMVESHQHGERAEIFLMEDGAGPHSAAALNNHHRARGINKLSDWPAQSPDLNPIERVWAYIRSKVSYRIPFPMTKKALIDAWIEEWKAIPVAVTNKFIEDMANEKLQECYRQGGDNKFHG